MLHICKEWKIQCCNTVVVGDHLQDIESGKAAGTGRDNDKSDMCQPVFSCSKFEDWLLLIYMLIFKIVTVLINNSSNVSFKEIADHNVNTLMELVNDLQTEQVMKSC